MTGTRENQLVELVDEYGESCGEATVAAAHSAPGLRHRAFSVHLLDHTGRLLLQQRASVKTRFALRWANATCGHPAPGETVITAATRRLVEEIGITSVDLVEVGVYGYLATDPRTGLVENEYDHVLLGILDPDHAPARPDPSEVAALRWVGVADLMTELKSRPTDFAPWLAGVTDVAMGSSPGTTLLSHP